MEKIKFVDYSELIGKLRTQLMVDTETIMKSIPNNEINIEDDSLGIISDGGIRTVIKLFYNGTTIDVITDTKLFYEEPDDFADLETDDMVAIYEFVYGEYENKLNSI